MQADVSISFLGLPSHSFSEGALSNITGSEAAFPFAGGVSSSVPCDSLSNLMSQL